MSARRAAVEEVLALAPPTLRVRARLERIEVELPTCSPLAGHLAGLYCWASLLLLLWSMLEGPPFSVYEPDQERLLCALLLGNAALAVSSLPRRLLGLLGGLGLRPGARALASAAIALLPGLANLLGVALLGAPVTGAILASGAASALYLHLAVLLVGRPAIAILDPAKLEIREGPARRRYPLDAISRVERNVGWLPRFYLDGRLAPGSWRLSREEQAWLGALLAATIRRRRASLACQGHDLAAPAAPPAELLARLERG